MDHKWKYTGKEESRKKRVVTVTSFMIFHLVLVLLLKLFMKDSVFFEPNPNLLSIRNLNIEACLIFNFLILYQVNKKGKVTNGIAWAFTLNLLIPNVIFAFIQGAYLPKILNLAFINRYMAFYMGSQQKKRGMVVCLLFFILLLVCFVLNPDPQVTQGRAIVISLQIIGYLTLANIMTLL